MMENNYPDDHSDLNYTHYTINSALESSFTLESKAQNILDLNSHLLNAMSAYEENDLSKLINSYRAVLSQLERSPDASLASQISAKCNLAVAHYYNCQNQICVEYIEEALQHFDEVNAPKENLNPHLQFLLLKCWCNLMVAKLSNGDDIGFKEVMFDLMGFLDNLVPQKRQKALQALIYLLFRIQSLEDYGMRHIEKISRKISFENQGCFYIISGLLVNLSTKEDYRKAVDCYSLAYSVFEKADDQVFMLLSLRMIIQSIKDSLSESNPKQGLLRSELRSGLRSELRQYEEMYQALREKPVFEKIRLDVLFDNFSTRMGVVRHLVKMIKSKQQMVDLDPGSIFESRLQDYKKDEEKTWRIALRLNILKSINSAQKLLQYNKSLIENEKDSLTRGSSQLRVVLEILEKETNPIILDKLESDTYTRHCVSTMRSSINKIVSGISKIALRKIFEDHKWKRLKTVGFSQRLQNPNQISEIQQKSVNIIKLGGYLEKFHYTTRGSKKQFFQLVDETTLRWASKKSYINNLRYCHSYHCSEIRALLYGKVTRTFMKGKNRQKEPWLCFSILITGRPYDLYCDEDNIDFWVIGLSHLIKKYNPQAYVLSPGKYYWRKFKYVLISLVNFKLKKAHGVGYAPQQSMTFARALVIYGRLRDSNSRGI